MTTAADGAEPSRLPIAFEDQLNRSATFGDVNDLVADAGRRSCSRPDPTAYRCSVSPFHAPAISWKRVCRWRNETADSPDEFPYPAGSVLT
jgi:hypothetical protein